jgi:uncharacterized HAD superfamily protein
MLRQHMSISSSAPVFGIDIDNVLAATDPMIRKLIRKYCGVNANQEQITRWRYSEALPISPKQEQFVFEQFHSYYCRKVGLVNGARRAVRRLAGFTEIWLLTQRPESALEGTLEWLKINAIRYDRLIFTKDKTEYASDLWGLVEDNGSTAMAAAELGIREVYLMDYPWNRMASHRPNIMRVQAWNEIVLSVMQHTVGEHHFIA